jgi:hypothetical protein
MSSDVQYSPTQLRRTPASPDGGQARHASWRLLLFDTVNVCSGGPNNRSRASLRLLHSAVALGIEQVHIVFRHSLTTTLRVMA